MKLYDSKEIRAILKIATENSSTDEPDAQMGLSIDELRQLASDVGIDPKEITRQRLKSKQILKELNVIFGVDHSRTVIRFW